MSASERRAAYAELAPFAALDAATRPIFYAHTVKNMEACHRLEQGDPFADATYLRALLSFIVPPRREWRARRHRRRRHQVPRRRPPSRRAFMERRREAVNQLTAAPPATRAAHAMAR